MIPPPLSPKQTEYVLNSTATWNFAHGSVRSGKTVCVGFRFLQALTQIEANKEFFIAAHTFDTAYRNVVVPFMESNEMKIFQPFLTWSGKKLYFQDKEITILGAKDEGALKNFQGTTINAIYCNEMALFPESIIEMIDTRLSREHSKGFADMNPDHPSHILKKWIDKGVCGDPTYYSLHFTLNDNPFITDEYKRRIRESLSGVYYKRYYLGEWCMAEGAIFDFFDRNRHICSRPPRAAEYWYAAIDHGNHNNFACLLIGVNTGQAMQSQPVRWVEKEYVWNPTKQGRQKTNGELADDVEAFIGPYGVSLVIVDPSALAFKLELQKRGFHVIDANNDVFNGIQHMTTLVHRGDCLICEECETLIEEMQAYVWDIASAKKGVDKPLKKNDHCVDALRYGLYSHRPQVYNPYSQQLQRAEWVKNRFEPTRTSW